MIFLAETDLLEFLYPFQLFTAGRLAPLLRSSVSNGGDPVARLLDSG
jgi:hypothetical protein